MFGQGSTWIKKDGGLFDVTMGAYDGAEICELIGTYLLFLLGKKIDNKNIGLYRDDGLAILKKLSGPQLERMKKEFQRIFREKGLEIVIECNKKIVDYLDVTLNLNNGRYKPYRKPGDEINYIHTRSDHPKSIIKQLPLSIENRLSMLSSSEIDFNEAKAVYQEALSKNGYTHTLQYQPNLTPTPRRNRKRNIIWFNPPFSEIVQTNIGRKFLNLIGKHFPRGSRLAKIFNRNTLKISYGCMPNINSFINAHNRAILNESTSLIREGCNCRNRDSCPLDGECLTKNVLYEACVSSNLPAYEKRLYIGITADAFKSRFGNHQKSFNNVTYKDETELSKEIWAIKDKGGTFDVKWRIIKQEHAYNPASDRCRLCTCEKVEILDHKSTLLLNKRTEILNKCRHKNRFLLKNS